MKSANSDHSLPVQPPPVVAPPIVGTPLVAPPSQQVQRVSAVPVEDASGRRSLEAAQDEDAKPRTWLWVVVTNLPMATCCLIIGLILGHCFTTAESSVQQANGTGLSSVVLGSGETLSDPIPGRSADPLDRSHESSDGEEAELIARAESPHVSDATLSPLPTHPPSARRSEPSIRAEALPPQLAAHGAVQAASNGEDVKDLGPHHPLTVSTSRPISDNAAGRVPAGSTPDNLFADQWSQIARTRKVVPMLSRFSEPLPSLVASATDQDTTKPFSAEQMSTEQCTAERCKTEQFTTAQQTSDRCTSGQCQSGLDRLGTAIDWANVPEDAYRMAQQEDKLVFLIHVSGNFKIPGFT